MDRLGNRHGALGQAALYILAQLRVYLPPEGPLVDLFRRGLREDAALGPCRLVGRFLARMGDAAGAAQPETQSRRAA